MTKVLTLGDLKTTNFQNFQFSTELAHLNSMDLHSMLCVELH